MLKRSKNIVRIGWIYLLMQDEHLRLNACLYVLGQSNDTTVFDGAPAD